MVLQLPTSFGSCVSGDRINLVAKLECWDPLHDAHWMTTTHDQVSFMAWGLLDGSGDSFSLLNAEFRKQWPIPIVAIDDKTTVIKHFRPTWDTLHQVIELCSGFGGMTQGLTPVGFQTVAVVDFNDRFLKLHEMHSDVHHVLGDVNKLSTLVELGKIYRGSGTMAAGFACQPFSRLGDERGALDDRAMCLRGVLAIAYYLQVHAIVLECVQPAALNSFVESEIGAFQKITGFHCAQQDYHLQDVWVSRRSRAWWLLTSPMLGKISLDVWPKNPFVSKVRHVIPFILPWAEEDEDDLALTEIEKDAFGVCNNTVCKYLLNFDSCAPCALHSWGSQMHACQCGCRSAGLSEHRLREKGLFGCLVNSCPTETKESTVRHIHPNEVMMLCGFDPVIDFGSNARLSLAAASQMASPIQTAWVFAILDERLQNLRGQTVSFKAEAQMHAFMTWLVMRGRQVWPPKKESIDDPKAVSLIQFWDQVSHLSMQELMFPNRWPDLPPHAINVASVLDFLIRQQQAVVGLRPCLAHDGDVPMTVHDDDEEDMEPTPWHYASNDIPCFQPLCDACVVVFHHLNVEPMILQVSENVTLLQLIHAHEKLVGPFQIAEIHDQHGMVLPHSLILKEGQILHIHCTADLPQQGPTAGVVASEAPPGPAEHASDVADLSGGNASVSDDKILPDLNQGPANVPVQSGRSVDDLSVVSHFGTMPALHTGVCPAISPTLPWTVPAHEVPDLPDSSGQSSGFAEHESLISAAPLLGLSDLQFLKLRPPTVVVNKHLSALRSQVLTTQDRQLILSHQGDVWSDDENFHQLDLLVKLCRDKKPLTVEPSREYMMIDPLLMTGWVNHGFAWCHAWARSHPEIKQHQMIVLTACMFQEHWIPVVLTPQGDVLHFCAWDAPSHSHDALNAVVEELGRCLGFQRVSILRHQRLYLVTDKCGAVAMSFLHHSVFSSMLPTSDYEVNMVHARLRAVFSSSLDVLKVAMRPWIWGAGDEDDEPFLNEPGQSSTSVSAALPTAVATQSFSHVCISKEQRLDLLRQKGKMWGDDEVRFHITHMLNHPNTVVARPFAVIPGFATLDPLLLTTWDTIGPTLCEAWCKRHPEVSTRGFHVVTAFLSNEHWFPVWMVPHGRTLVVHVVQDDLVDHQLLLPLMEIFKVQYEFHECVLHTIPSHLPSHELCGAAAVAFLGHIMVGANLPTDLSALRDYHANMKAAYVHALHEGSCCICAVAWGAGFMPNTVHALAEELVKHGVPESASNQRAQQAIKAIGSDNIQQALQSKNIWRSLKVLGNNVKFQFLLPAELAEVIASNKSTPVGKRLRMPGPKTRPKLPEAVDPSKLSLPEGVFISQGHPVPQIQPKQLGPLAHGIALLTLAEAQPYLKAGKQVSQEPLAIAVFLSPGDEVDTCLPHTKVTVPCVCIANREPLLADATIVQLGQGFVEKQVFSATIPVDQMDVVTVKMLVYRDECPFVWEDFTAAPIKHLVRTFPVLTRCMAKDCQCDHWHNPNSLPLQDPILDVWRRQFLKTGFKTVAPDKADMFSVCLRVPRAIMTQLLAMSGTAGIYGEPRSPDGKEVLAEYVIVWTPKKSPSELSHLRQTNPAVVGVARLGDRRGLRVFADQASKIHEMLRPETAFLPGGLRTQYIAGPFPWGVDRQGICKALRQAGWIVKALQPMQPVPGRGTMWILQAVDAPPQSIFHMSHGEVVVSQHKQSGGPKPQHVASVGAASTLTLCSQAGSGGTEIDPWLQADPWGAYAKPASGSAAPNAQDSLQQLEERIQSAIMAKLPTTMEQDDLPGRMSSIESQVQMLMNKNHSLESQFVEFSNQSNQQFAVVQQQINQQGQAFHGQLENHTQSVQAMFESQMQQIRNLLTKRPRDEQSME